MGDSQADPAALFSFRFHVGESRDSTTYYNTLLGRNPQFWSPMLLESPLQLKGRGWGEGRAGWWHWCIGFGAGTAGREKLPAVAEIVFRVLQRLREGPEPGIAGCKLIWGARVQAQGLPLPERLGRILLAKHIGGEE